MAFPLLLCSFFFSSSLLILSSSSSSSSSPLQTSSSHLQLDSSLLCGLVDCVNGDCVASSSVPFYKCECHGGWASPFNIASMPCVLPNCTINLGCSNSSSIAAPPSPPTTSSSVCSSDVCGNGKCSLSTSNSSTSYECRCNPGYANIFNASNGYCLPECAIGSDCKDLNIPLIGVTPPPPPPPPSGSGVSTESMPTPLGVVVLTTMFTGALSIVQLSF